MTPAVAEFLLDLLNRQTLNAGADDLEQSTAMVLRARAELITALTAELDEETP